MAQRTIVQLIDDLDGGEADETLTFALDGAEYELDLTVGHAKELREMLAPYVLAGRRSNTRTNYSRALDRRRGARVDHTMLDLGVTPAVVREWAKKQGITVSDRGRVSAEIVAAFKAAH